MIKNYFTTAFRIFKRDKAYSSLNVLGLTLGITASLLLFAYSFNEAQYDQHHEKKDRIVRVVMDVKFGDEARGVAVVPAALGFFMQQQAKEVEAYAMLRSIPGFQVKKGEEVVAEQGMYYASQGVLDIFTWHWLAGDKASALTPHNTIVLSRSLAVKYFGSVDQAVGEVIVRDNDVQYKVTGVIEDVTQKGHFNPRAFVSLWDDSKTTNWRDWNWTTYLLLTNGRGSLDEVNATLQRAFDQNLSPQLAQGGGTIKFSTQQLTDIYYESRRDFEMEPNEGNRIFIRGFAMVGLFLLLLAIINYINLVTAQSERRAREVGVKKVFGVSRRALRGQFFAEALLYIIISILGSVVLLFLLRPVFAYFTGSELPLSILFGWKGIAGAVVFVFLLTLVSGAYPAFYISSFQPSRVLKSGTLLSKPGGNLNLRKLLIIVQLSVSLLMIIGILGVFLQLQFIYQYHLGFDKERVLKFNLPKAAIDNYRPLRETLLANPSITGVASAIELPGEKPPVNDFNYETVEGVRREILQQMWVDEGFFTTLNIPLISGNNFRFRAAGDSSSPGVLVNRAFVEHAGWKMDEVAGKTLSSHDWSDKVIGVVEDFHVISLHDKIEPLIFRYTSSAPQMIVKFNGSFNETIQLIEKSAVDVAGSKLAAWSFLDTDFQKQYEKDEKRADLLAAFAFLVLFIACLGLLGMSAYDVRQRRKEIGIRKILGASAPGLLVHLSKPYLHIGVLSSLLAIPAANYFLTEWLQEFAYSIEVSWWMLVLPALLLLLIAMVVVSIQTTKATRTNPAEVLKYE